MKRFRTLLVILCPNNHQNLIDDRVLAETQEEAKNATLLKMQRTKCRNCDSLLTNRINLLETQEIPLYETYDVLGYVCHCGESHCLPGMRGDRLRARMLRMKVREKYTVVHETGQV